MQKALKVHLFKVTPIDDSEPLEDVLQVIESTPIPNRLRLINFQEMRLEVLERPNAKRPYWLLDFGRIRRDNGPGRASKEKLTERFDLDDGDGFGELTAALYDAKHGWILIQFNAHGPRAGSVESYLSEFNQAATNVYSFDVRLKDDAQSRLQRKKLFTRLEMKVAPAQLSAAFRAQNVSLISALQSAQNTFGGDYVKLTVSLNRGGKEGLRLSQWLGALGRLVSTEGHAVKALTVTGKDPDHKDDVINLLSEKLERKFTDLMLDAGLQYPRDERWRALERAYSGWKPIITGKS
jgi:hypothetical protein